MWAIKFELKNGLLPFSVLSIDKFNNNAFNQVYIGSFAGLPERKTGKNLANL